MLIPSAAVEWLHDNASLSRRVNANSQHYVNAYTTQLKLIKKGEC